MDQILTALVLSGFMGLLGQGVRAIIGLKSAAALAAGMPTQQSQFNAAYLGLSLMIGFIAGVLAGIGIGLDQVIHLNVPASGAVDPKLLLGIAAAGYAGADFIENAFTRLLPDVGAPPPPQAQPVGVAAPAIAPPPAAVTPPTGATQVTGLADALRVAAPKLDLPTWTPALSAALTKYGMTSHRRIAASVGQFLVEAGAALQETTENLNYTHAQRLHDVFKSSFPTVADAEPYVGNPQAIANRVYANKLGNGDETSGDGWLFRGRGLIQLTGRTEYTQFAASIGKSLDEVVRYCETPEGAAMSGCWYLSSRGCIPFADSWQISEITLRVNGSAMLGDAQRIAYSNSMLKALGG